MLLSIQAWPRDVAARGKGAQCTRTFREMHDASIIAHPVLRHRMVTTFHADSEQITTDDVIDMLLRKIPVELEKRARRLASD